jgi:putative transposase
MSKYERFNHAKTFLRYHLIFSTKYRRKVLNPIRDDLLAAMKEAESKNGNFHIEIDEVDQDHIHLLVRIKPSESIDRVVHALKQQSTYMMWKLHHDFLRIYYWSGQHHLWTRGYFASTIGDVSEKTIIQYIKNQG